MKPLLEIQLYKEIEKTNASETIEKQISTEKGTAKSLQQAVADNNLVKEGTKMICQEHEMTEEGIQGDKILAKETQNEVVRLNVMNIVYALNFTSVWDRVMPN